METIDYKQKIKDYMNSSEVDTLYKSMLNNLFPELKESDNKRMIQYFKDLAPFDKADELYEKYGFSHKDAIAWLEKQAEHANFRNKIQIGDKVTRNKDGVLVNLSQLNRVAKKQGEQKPADKVEPKFKVGNKIKLAIEPNYPAREIIAIQNDAYYFDEAIYLPFSRQDEWELIEQKAAEWSEEDDDDAWLNDIISKAECNLQLNKDEIDWLKSIKDRVQSKQEWSEEDDEMYKKIETAIDSYYAPFSRDAEEMSEWFKNLKDRVQHQNRWKPSKEQMEYLHKYAEQNNYDGAILTSLYNDLKQL